MSGWTTRGRSLLAGGLAAAVCAILLDERDLLRVGVAIAALPVIAAVIVLGRRIRLTAHHQLTPDRLHAGAEGRIDVTLTHRGLVRGRPVQISEPATPDLTAGMRCVLPSLKRGASVAASYPIRPAHRGRFSIGPLTARSSDPLGLCTARRTLSAPFEVVVLPTTVPLRALPMTAGGHSAANGAAHSGTGDGDPDVLVRPYQLGDDIRTIHWRATARRDELVVRTRQTVAHGEATIVLDHRSTHRGSGPHATLEAAISAVASIGAHLLEADYRLSVRGHNAGLISTGPLDDLLLALVDIAPDDGPLTPPRATGLMIAVTGPLTAADARRLTAAHLSGAIALVVDDPGFSDEAIAVLNAAGWRTRLLPPGTPLAPVWNTVCTRSVTVVN